MKNPKIAFITGITGQDGAYLAQFLLEKGYSVHGLLRWDWAEGTDRLKTLGIEDRLHLHHGDMTDAGNLTRLIKAIEPDEIYNLAALTHVQVSFETPSSAFQANAMGTLNLLESLRILDMPKIRLYQASSSEMFGSAPPPQNETTPFQPCSPYGVSKLAAYWLVRTYRDSYGLHASNGILFNHESPLRGQDFVTRKIARAAVRIAAGLQDALALGNLDAMRDWGHARDFVRGMWLMLQQDAPDDYVLATGEAHTVRNFATRAFAQAGIKLTWTGVGLNEQGADSKGRVLVTLAPSLFRPKEVHHLRGDSSRAREKLGWRPETTLDGLIREMVEAEQGVLEDGKEPPFPQQSAAA
ncbi:MAG: GDP-mannose 4,6-dehydratase [Alphaproteobacteria bacterium]|nr:GDP-mannose 4,6-dehydratase [Alphaproteobacteria bacterium]